MEYKFVIMNPFDMETAPIISQFLPGYVWMRIVYQGIRDKEVVRVRAITLSPGKVRSLPLTAASLPVTPHIVSVVKWLAILSQLVTACLSALDRLGNSSYRLPWQVLFQSFVIAFDANQHWILLALSSPTFLHIWEFFTYSSVILSYRKKLSGSK